jgi:hypothetical protein
VIPALALPPLVPMMAVMVRMTMMARTTHDRCGAISLCRVLANPQHCGQGKAQAQAAEGTQQSVSRPRGRERPGDAVELVRFHRQTPWDDGAEDHAASWRERGAS